MFGMRRRWVIRTMAALGFGVILASATPVWAQGAAGGGLGGAGGGLGGAGGGLGGAGGGLGGAGRGGAGGAGGGAGAGGGSNSITGGGGLGGGGGGGSSGTTDPTNFLSKTYSNPLYMGRYSAASTTTVGSSSSPGTGGSSSSTTASNSNLNGIGGFGQPSLGTTSGSNSRMGGTAGVGGNRGGGSLSSSQSGQTQSTTRISFSASLKFAPPVKASTEVETDLRDILGRSTSLSNPNGIQVTVTDRVATLRGKVANNDERSLAEGLIRLAPGVRGVKNELEAQ